MTSGPHTAGGNPLETLEVLPQISHNQGLYEQHTIPFATNDGIGIPLATALLGNPIGLLNGTSPAFTPEMGVTAKIGLKIQVVGYGDAYSRQIMARRSNKGADSISLNTLATKIAEEMQRYMGDREVVWHGQALTLDDIILKRLHHVTQGSWQPEFAVLRRNSAM